MFQLPFALALSSPHGALTAIATFREVADLRTFYAAWAAEVEPETVREARFVHTGRAVRTMRPDAGAEVQAWFLTD